jgi:hypothetical protein
MRTKGCGSNRDLAVRSTFIKLLFQHWFYPQAQPAPARLLNEKFRSAATLAVPMRFFFSKSSWISAILR